LGKNVTEKREMRGKGESGVERGSPYVAAN